MITIIDYGMGNLGSIKNMFKYIGAEVKIESNPDNILKANKILLPGVGSFDAAMTQLSKHNLIEVLHEKALSEKIPILGICLGMQLLTNGSEEGEQKGLGWIPAKTVSFRNHVNKNIKVPHMGWNLVDFKQKNEFTNGLDHFDETRFYFVHSYFVKCEHPENILGCSQYGLDFDSAIYQDNIFGVQFHPEKSHKFGMALFKNFAKL